MEAKSDNGDGLIEQAAKDYDMSVEEVERIWNLYPYENFYPQLEEYIKKRRSLPWKRNQPDHPSI